MVIYKRRQPVHFLFTVNETRTMGPLDSVCYGIKLSMMECAAGIILIALYQQHPQHNCGDKS